MTGIEILAGFGCVWANLFGRNSCTRKTFDLIAGSVSAVIALIASIKPDKSGTVWHTKADVAINRRSYGDVICHSDFDSQWCVNFEKTSGDQRNFEKNCITWATSIKCQLLQLLQGIINEEMPNNFSVKIAGFFLNSFLKLF